jgi:signal peptidase I
MNNKIIEQFIYAQKRRGKPFDITVTGISMEPFMFEGDIVTVQPLQPNDDYELGDVLVYFYKQEGMLVHRLLLKESGVYHCKGDNTIRLEGVTLDQIIGKVISVNGIEVTPCTAKHITLSYAVSLRFQKSGFDFNNIRNTEIYKLYDKIILNQQEDIMIYHKNSEMEYIPVDETSLTVFDPETGDVHFFDETGIAILDLLDEPKDLDSLVEKLSEMYDAPKDEIRSDVEQFLSETVDKKVIITL